ncbi:hypothetical protein CO115_01815 [Candidatus Falkowbacteria bacterium CG_4_9_14_3_um_filter_36_9]|uniref:Glycosyltransferase RgtA/B/C/D-like domain-containing protein n=1 Tax=Candidatus Falkowbacteria bacterium CG02_land_8_20_14_3_00_36_14 TaxID=1974560 RepID=A0A2M7DLI9_9BACT|nr:MAG: hypothetical protein COS18_04575 [Candidatus Falkowbacteria bacterium CG02_land_8_20_14_3_00_36_14]PIX10883.1 MAG: hypothetical protein COZ73_04260 [Candidatus Falkowbacteria bacterium CG_4_8_14_3_um_filter_36_11]PJA11222.1 MAG: hypothetical protein COX67_00960 [Candidatus Falkowbacteria bacterium CG_4_10_14_0_2_um_filter_36_22]PJB20115.1 MAG: hypothetical protein CO115_01815 [Candidatus Falkowbacteria bacterium CG_4_9_14_3_um_filter_36_9]
MKLFNNIKISVKHFWLLILFLLTALLHSSHVINSDEGLTLSVAWDIFNNKELYIDIFEFVAPGSFYAIFWIWKIFGASYFSAKLFSIIIIYFCAFGIHEISERLTLSKYSFLAPFIFVVSSAYWPIINYHIYNIFFIIWALYFFIKLLKDNSKKNAIFSGILTGIAILFLQPRGIIFLSTLSFFLIILLFKEKKLIWLKLNLYYLFFSILPVTLLLLKWPATLLWNNLIIFPIFNYSKIASVPFNLLIIFLIITLAAFWLLRNNKSKKIWLLVYIQLALLLSSAPLADHFHILIIIFPLYCLLPLLINKINNFNFFYSKTFFLLLIMTVFFIIWPSFIYFKYFPPFFSIKNYKFIDYIKDNCRQSKYLYSGPFYPSIYFETKKLNPTPYPWLITNHHTEKQFQEARQYLEKNKPECSVLNYAMVEKYRYDRNNPVDNFIIENYHFAYKDYNILIYKLNED